MKQTSERLGVKIVGGLKEVNTAWAGSSLLIDFAAPNSCTTCYVVVPTNTASGAGGR